MCAVWFGAGLAAGAAIGFFVGCIMKQSSCDELAAAYLRDKYGCGK